MDKVTKERAIEKILNREKLFKFKNSRFQRFLHDPFRTFFFYALSVIARIHPIWVTKKTPWGDKMSYYLPEGNQIYYYGFYESNLAIFIIRYIKENYTFIDIGANIGYYSILASSLVGDNGKVFCFEPTPRTFETLNSNCSVRKNITPINIALSDEVGTVKFMDYGSKLSAFNTLNPRKSGEISKLLKNGKEIEIKTTTLDNIYSEYKINPSFIKMDAEGHESKILRGMTTVLDISRPIISIEIGKDHEWRNNVRECFDILKNKNYRSYELSNEGYLSLRDLDANIETNIIFIPFEKITSLGNLIINHN